MTFRLTSKHLTIFAASDTTWISATRRPSLVRRSWRGFRALNAFAKIGVVATLPVAAGALYCAASHALYDWNERGTDLMFVDSEVTSGDLATEHFYIIEDWDQLKKTLSVGDVIVYAGTDEASATFIKNQLAAMRLKGGAMKFSNVGVIVKPFDPKTKKGPFMLEASRNTECIADHKGIIRKDQVQIVDAHERINAMTPRPETTSTNKTGITTPMATHLFPAYKRAAARRLQGVASITRQQEDAIAAFISAFEGVPIDRCPLLPIAAVSPKMYLSLRGWWEGTPDRKSVGGGELVENFFEALGLVNAGLAKQSSVRAAATFDEKKAAWKARRRAEQAEGEDGALNMDDTDVESSSKRRAPVASLAKLKEPSFYSLSNIGILPAHFANGLDARGSGKLSGESPYGAPSSSSAAGAATTAIGASSSANTEHATKGLRFAEGVGLAPEEAVSIKKWAQWFQAEEDRLEDLRERR